MNRLGLLILATLQKSDATNTISAMSVYEIKYYAKLSQSITTMHRTMNYLLNQGYVTNGVKDSKSSTFYISEKGKTYLKEML